MAKVFPKLENAQIIIAVGRDFSTVCLDRHRNEIRVYFEQFRWNNVCACG